MILTDVWLYNKVRSGAFHVSLSMSEPPWEQALICNSVHKSRRIDAVNRGGRAASCQSHPIILLRVLLHSHTCVSLTFPFWYLAVFLSSFQATRSPPACRRAAWAEALAPPCARAVTTSWTAEGKDLLPFQPTCQRAWLRCKHRVLLCFYGCTLEKHPIQISIQIRVKMLKLAVWIRSRCYWLYFLAPYFNEGAVYIHSIV